MLRYWLSITLVALCYLSLSAQDKADKPEASLKIGDPAPKLVVTKWMKGDAVQAFKPGNVYVVEFWATWCGPCIASMPHISDLQTEYKDKGLTIIGLTSKDPNNSEEQVADFVKNRGDIMQYNIAWCEDRATNDAFMKAAGRNGIPCSFVIDKQGNVAFIGHPMILDEVLPKVIDGTWNAKAEAKELEAKLESTFEKLQEASQKENGLEIFASIEKDTPRLATQFADFKMMLLLKNKKNKEAEALFNTVFEKSIKKKDANKLTSLCRTWGNPMVNTEKYNLELAVKAGEEAHKLAGPKDIGSLLAVAQAYDAVGNKAKASEAADKAIAAAPDQLKDRIKQMVQRYKK